MPKRTNPFQQLIAMVVELLENGSVVTESVEYPDPVAKNPREVDITVVRGDVGGRAVRIGVECTDLGRRATQPWVEMQYGKHSRLKVVDFVILVCDSGFSKTARAVAEDLGYLAIHPNIAKSELAVVLNKRFGMSVKMTEMQLTAAHFTFSGEGVTDKFRPTSDGDELMFLRHDGSVLVQAREFEKLAIVEELKNDLPNMLSDNASDRNVSVQMPSPRYYGERFYVLGTDGGSERLALVERLDIELVCSVPTGLT
ncbi:MAG: hypothetical protein QOE52_4761 [Mycobacterium sp.]|jgi:hypothetical protein|nr:hypothetical protein [Mycobacterium sp.]MDT5345577.1 hypothetical protein [Mycobacterium sp.]